MHINALLNDVVQVWLTVFKPLSFRKGSIMEKIIDSTGEQKKTKVVWKCSVCGYIEERYPDGLPKDYRCPVCNAKASKFKKMIIEV